MSLKEVLGSSMPARRFDGAPDRGQRGEAAKLVDNATLSAPRGSTSVIIPCDQLWGAHGRVVGSFVGAGTRRCFGAARDNGPVCSVARGQPPTVSETHPL